ncbi:MAG: response regulator transcription factor [Anaerolineales bacterium]|nr:response regulator transcription factor [Anaerolineales bacterium]
MSNPIQVLIVEDHAVVRAGLRALLETEPDMQVVGEAGDAETAVTQTLTLHPDVILMDLCLPDYDGLYAIQAIKRHNPQARILVLSNHAEDKRVRAVLHAGVTGYLLKDSANQKIVTAIRDVQQGNLVLHPLIAHIIKS